jgi:adenylate kinase family enzyme
MRRILIIGSAGAGKSTLAAQLGKTFGLPVIHLEAHFWQAGWRETPKHIWKQRVSELIQRESWIMDGNYGGTMQMRVDAADTVILLAFSRLRCLWRVLKRAIRHRGRARADLHPECPEHLPDWAFLTWIWNYPRTRLPGILEMLALHEPQKRIIVLRTPAEVRHFVATFRV